MGLFALVDIYIYIIYIFVDFVKHVLGPFALVNSDFVSMGVHTKDGMAWWGVDVSMSVASTQVGKPTRLLA